MLWGLLLVAVISIAAGTIFWPLFGSKDPWSIGTSPTALRLLRDKKEQVLRMIKDLEQEYEARAISPSEYAELRERYVNEVAIVSRRLLTLQGPHGPAVAADEPTAGGESQVAAAQPEAEPDSPESDTRASALPGSESTV